jgi:tricorn protease
MLSRLRREFRIHLSVSLAVMAFAASDTLAQNIHDTRLLGQPAVSAEHVAFVYAGDLWTARIDGSDVHRVTTADGDESSPVFSPDGALLAFTGNYDGNQDVYVVPVGGGSPLRLTYHPGTDVANAFTPDGRSVLFTSRRAGSTTRLAQLYTVPVNGGVALSLPIPTAFKATYSPDGSRIAYNPLPEAFLEWKHYRGGRASQIWLYTTATQAMEKVPQPATRSNDVDAMWLNDAIYFRSDRDGEFNIYAYDPAGGQPRQITHHTDFPVLAASAGGGHIIYEQAGYLHLLDPASGQSRRLTIGVPADLRETRPRWVSGNRYIRNASISPTGARAAFEFRGEVVTVPAENGDARNITNSAGANDRSPAWSPDGSRIAWFSDDGGEYRLHVAPQDGTGEDPAGRERVYDADGAGFYTDPQWSPDGKYIAYLDNSQSIYVMDLADGSARRIGGNAVYTPLSLVSGTWSPDSRWFAYTVDTQPLVTELFAYNVDDHQSHRITDGLSAVSEPVFDRNGKYLYVIASTDAGPVLDWFAQSNTTLPSTANIYAIVLRNDLPNPVARESDEEKATSQPADTAKTEAAKSDAKSAAKSDAKAPATRIDFDGIEQRIVTLPVPAANISGLAAGTPGMLYYTRNLDGNSTLHRYDIEKRKD